MRSKDFITMMKSVSPHLHRIIGFNPVSWITDDNNIMLVEGEDVALFEHKSPGVYSGHYMMKSRGSVALASCKKLLKEFFQEYDVEVLTGLTPVENLGARWMNKKLGFEQHLVVETANGPHLLVMMTREQYRSRYE